MLEEKRRIIEELRRVVGEEGAERASRDHHSKRRPRPCGMTIHTGLGCVNGCVYCYAYSMGFPARDEPYPLSGEEMALALAMNPHVFPERTLAAFGSVTEPFLPRSRSRALEYLGSVWRWLRLPEQLSTKMLADEAVVEGLRGADPRLDALVTVVTIERHRVLEPRAPSPLERLRSWGEAGKRLGISVTLFMRPIIPGVTDREAEKILSASAEAGVTRIVTGCLRITPGIVDRLRRAGVPTTEILRRAPRMPRDERDQVSIRCNDLRKRVEDLARDLGMKVFPSACASNIDAHGEYCALCDYGPCGDPSKDVARSCTEVDDLMQYLGSRCRCEEVTPTRIVLRGRASARHLEVLSSIARKRVVVV